MEFHGSLKKATLGLIVSLFALVLLLQPLGYSLKRLYFSSQAIHTIAELRQNQPELFPGTAKFRSLNAHYGEEELIEINAEIELLSQDLNHIQERVDLFSMELSKALNQTVRMNVDITPYLQYSSQSQ